MAIHGPEPVQQAARRSVDTRPAFLGPQGPEVPGSGTFCLAFLPLQTIDFPLPGPWEPLHPHISPSIQGVPTMRIANILALAATCFMAGKGIQQSSDVLPSGTIFEDIQFRVNCEDMQTIRIPDDEYFERLAAVDMPVREALDICEKFLVETQHVDVMECVSIQLVLEGVPHYKAEYYTEHTNRKKKKKHRRYKLTVGILGKQVKASFISYRLPGTIVKTPMLEMPNGMLYNDITVGDGAQVRRGSTVRIDYVLSLLDGVIVTNTHEENMSRVFKVEDAPIEGIAAGLIGMRANGKRKLVIPPSLAYGRLGFKNLIPPDATLVIDLVLRTVQ